MKTYLITLFMTITCLQMVQAQTKNYLIYKEYDPDYWVVLTPGEHFDVDIDNDGNGDVRYDVFRGNNSKTGSYVQTINGWLACSYCTFDSGYENVFFDLSIPLDDPFLVWGGQCHFESLVQHPSITPLEYKVALRFHNGENYYYGWAEFEEIREAYYDRGRFHVARTCFCAIPNYPFEWGQTSLTEDVEEMESISFATVHPNPTDGQVTIIGKDLKQAEVFNTLGQRVATATGKGKTLQINIANLPAGVYFVNITDEEGRKCVRKVVKE